MKRVRPREADGVQSVCCARGGHERRPEPHSRLEEILERSHIVFRARAGAGCELGRSLERYCERRGKPLILLEVNSVAALADALAASFRLRNAPAGHAKTRMAGAPHSACPMVHAAA